MLQKYLQILELALKKNLGPLCEASFIKIGHYIRNSWSMFSMGQIKGLLDISVSKLESLESSKSENKLLLRVIVNLLVDCFLIFFHEEGVSGILIKKIMSYFELKG